MSKLSDDIHRGLAPETIEWINKVTQLWNLGKYAMTLIASIPDANTQGNNGEFFIQKDGATWYIYVYTTATDGYKKVAMSNL